MRAVRGDAQCGTSHGALPSSLRHPTDGTAPSSTMGLNKKRHALHRPSCTCCSVNRATAISPRLAKLHHSLHPFVTPPKAPVHQCLEHHQPTKSNIVTLFKNPTIHSSIHPSSTIMAHVKRDDVKQAWEETEFPLVCETCLGDNPYVRMTKEPYGKKCQVCESPFTVFAWQAGTKGRMKRVEICRACAQAKNVCQVCIYDLQYGLPVKVRDKVLREAAGSSAPNPATAVPQSTANRAWFSAQQQRLLEQGEGVAAQGTALAHAQLSEMAQMEPRYERNLPKLCSFFAKGECDRGSSCPFRHELPRDRNDPMNKVCTNTRGSQTKLAFLVHSCFYCSVPSLPHRLTSL